MTNIPTTPAEFTAFVEKHKAEWPQSLRDDAERARIVIERIAMNPAWQNNLMEEMKSGAWLKDMQTLMTFAENYGEWKASK